MSRFIRRIQIMSILVLVAITNLCSGCNPGQDSPTSSRSLTPSLTTIPPQVFEVVYPLAFSELIGGQALRVTLLHNDSVSTLEEIATQVEFWSPGGELYATLNCIDQNDWRCLTNSINLPIRDAAGTWQIQARSKLENGQFLESTGTFSTRASFSEGLEKHFGFWLDTSSPLFAYAGPPFAVPELKFHPYPEGGYVILSNSSISGGVEGFVMLDIHWRPAPFPVDQEAVLEYIQEQAGPHGMTVSYNNLKSEEAGFLERQAWRVNGYWEEPLINGVVRIGADTYPAEWMVFSCPQSEYTWTILITSRSHSNMPGLREILETFRCPVVY